MTRKFRQLVRNVQGSTALVESKKGNVYPVIVSDYVRLKKEVHVGDTAWVRRINGKYYMVDVEKKVPVEDRVPQDDFDMADNWGNY